jgi:excinuclease ABC subunit A
MDSDYVVDLGPGAGVNGGYIVATGTPQEIIASDKSLTGNYLSGKMKIPLPSERRNPKQFITVTGARENNLKNLNVNFPLGVFTAITGVSGSGKSSLVIEILYKALSSLVMKSKEYPGAFDEITGVEAIDKVIDIDQSPIGRTPRSNPATYTGLFTPIRELFAKLPESKVRGYKAGRFSFNVAGGRCESCEGDGDKKN